MSEKELFSKNKKKMVELGGILFTLAGSMVGLSLATLQVPILTEMNAMKYFSLLSIFSTLGLVIMTPIGAKLGDLMGRKNILVISGIICVLSCIGMGVVRVFVPFMILRLVFGLAQGAFLSTPYILARELNEPSDVPKAMGLLATSVAIGGFLGGIIAGIFKDLGYLSLGIMFPIIPFILGIILIYFYLPNKKREGKVYIDVPGIIFLSLSLLGILLSLNFGNRLGWADIKIILGLLIGIVSIVCFVIFENKSPDPIISMRLFKNKNYVAFLILGFICYFYISAMSVYSPLAVQKIMGKSGAIAGSLQMPRTIITIVLSVLVGVWVSKKTENMWKAMAIATILVAIPFAVLSTTNPNTSALIYFILLGITGIAESFRGVSITPAAQATLEPKDLGVGTALVNFTNTLSILVSSVVCGIVYDMKTKSNHDSLENIMAGVNSVYMLNTIIAIIGFLLVIFVIRKQINQHK